MSNTYTGKLIKRMPAPGDYDWDDEWHDNEKIDDFVAGAALAGNKVLTGGVVSAGAGLNADYTAVSAQIAGLIVAAIAGSLVLVPNDLNYIYIDDTGTVAAAVGPPTGDYVPLGLVDTDLSAVARVADVRVMSDKVAPPAGVEITGGIAGLIVSNNATDAEHDIDVSPGLCKDSTGMANILQSAAIIKQIDAAWAAGSAAGGLLNGVVAANKLYHVYLLRKDTDGSGDVGFLADGDDIATYLPAGYSAYRWRCFVLTDASSNIRNFDHLPGDVVVFKSAFEILTDVSTAFLTSQNISGYIPAGRTAEIYAGGNDNGNFIEFGVSAEAFSMIDTTSATDWAGIVANNPSPYIQWIPVLSSAAIFVKTSSLATDIWLKAVKIIC